MPNAGTEVITVNECLNTNDENDTFIGDCGITMQRIGRWIRPEIGCHINKKYHRMGLASEAARCCRDYIFENTPFNSVYSYMTADNAASSGVAVKNGMKLVDEYTDTDGKRLKLRHRGPGRRPIVRNGGGCYGTL